MFKVKNKRQNDVIDLTQKILVQLVNLEHITLVQLDYSWVQPNCVSLNGFLARLFGCANIQLLIQKESPDEAVEMSRDV